MSECCIKSSVCQRRVKWRNRQMFTADWLRKRRWLMTSVNRCISKSEARPITKPGTMDRKKFLTASLWVYLYDFQYRCIFIVLNCQSMYTVINFTFGDPYCSDYFRGLSLHRRSFQQPIGNELIIQNSKTYRGVYTALTYCKRSIFLVTKAFFAPSDSL